MYFQILQVQYKGTVLFSLLRFFHYLNENNVE